MIQEIRKQGLPLKVILLSASLLLVKLILLPYAQNTDADAVCRIFNSIEWMRHPTWIMTSVWGPFHYYLIGVGLMVWNNQICSPVLINLILSSITLFPFYFFTRREFNEKGAFIATVFFAISPILFRNSFLALSETPYLFFVAMTMNFLSKAIKEERNHYFTLAGLFITIAAGFRYEAWLLALLFSAPILFSNRWKNIFLFESVALLFPIIWMIQNYVAKNNALYSFAWTANSAINNESMGLESYLRRIWFFPFSWMIALGPPVAFITIKEIVSCYKRKQFSRISWTIPLLIILLFFFVNAYKGVLLLQHRFTGTLVILSLPFFALYFTEQSLNKIRQAWIFGILTVGLSFVWNTTSVTPLPRLKNRNAEKVTQLIKNEINNSSGLIIDFWEWDNTYYIALQSGLPSSNMMIVEGAKNSPVPEDGITKVLKEHPEGIIVLRKDSKLFHETKLSGNSLAFNWINTPLPVKNIFENNEVVVLKYSR